MCTPAAADVQQAHDALDAADAKVTMYTAANDSATDALDMANSDLATAVTVITALDDTATATEVAAANAAYQQAIAAQAAAMAASDTAKMNLATATQAYRDAYAALEAVDPTSTALMEARTKIAMLEDAAEKAAEKAEADLAALQGQIDEATEKLAMLRKQIEDAAKALADAKAKAMAAGYSDALKRYTDHLEATGTASNGMAQRRNSRLESENGTTGGAMLSVKRVDSVTIKAKDFVVQTGMPADVGMGWTGRTLVRDAKNIATSPETVPGTVTATVYTDIEVAGSRTLDSLDWNATNFPDAFPGATAVPAVITGVSGQKRVTLASGSQMWPGSANGSKIPTMLNVTNTIMDSFTGMLHGISGTFRCGTGPCSIQMLDDDSYSVIGTITFDAASSAVVRIADTDYMTFGYWTTEPDEGTGAAHHYSVGTFAMPVAPAPAASTMTGKAMYKGPAAGVYSETAHSDKTARSGSFTAAASLTADFGDGSSLGYISGMVSEFMSNGESLGDWSVTLGGDMKPAVAEDGSLVAHDAVSGAVNNSALALGASGTVMGLTSASANVDSGSTTGKFDGLMGTGNWQAQFSGAQPATNTTDGPDHVSGTFDVNAANVVRISGAFGATKE